MRALLSLLLPLSVFAAPPYSLVGLFRSREDMTKCVRVMNGLCFRL